MNERIRELAKQADPDYTGEYDDDMGHALVGNEAIQKFAELIVAECAGIDFRHKVGMTTDQEFDTSRVILEHFGVEE